MSKKQAFLIERPIIYIAAFLMILMTIATGFFAYLTYRPITPSTIQANIVPEEMERIKEAVNQIMAGIVEQRKLKASNEAVLSKLQSLQHELDNKMAALDKRRKDIELDHELDHVELQGYKELVVDIAQQEKKVGQLKKMEQKLKEIIAIDKKIADTKLLNYIAPADQDYYRLYMVEYQQARQNNNWDLLDSAVKNLANFLKTHKNFCNLLDYQYDNELKNILESEGVEFGYFYLNKEEYFHSLLQEFKANDNQIKMGNAADIMAGLYQDPEISIHFKKDLETTTCPGNGKPLIDYLDYIYDDDGVKPVPANVEFLLLQQNTIVTQVK